MASVIRIGAGAQVERFQPDVLEEIRIMAEAGQPSLGREAPRPRLPFSSFARLLGAVLAPAA